MKRGGLRHVDLAVAAVTLGLLVASQADRSVVFGVAVASSVFVLAELIGWVQKRGSADAVGNRRE